MGTAFTPGLTISRHYQIRKSRLLPLKGEVLVTEGQRVEPDTVLARAELPGDMDSVRLADTLGVDPSELASVLTVQEGDPVEKGDLLAETKGLFGLFKSRAVAPVTGQIEFVSQVTGHMGIRKPPTPVEVLAYISGTVTKVMPEDGAVIETSGAFLQGIFGVGGERQGTINVVVSGPDAELTEDAIPAECAGQVLVGGSLTTAAALKLAADRGAAGVVVGGIVDRELATYVGHDIGVAITGHEEVGATLILTEGFGKIDMATRTFDLLKSLQGRAASINGATQIRAGAMRPEIAVPDPDGQAAPPAGEPGDEAHQLAIGTPIRIIRVPYFGQIAKVSGLPAELTEIGTGAMVRVLEAELAGGEKVMVPRANVEIMQSG